MIDDSATTYRLRLLGTPAIVGDDGPIGGRVAQRHRLALLAVLSTAPDHTASRDKLVSLLWPDSETRRARHLLSVALHEIRKTLGENALLAAGDDLRLDPGVVEPDLLAFRAALECGDAEAAVGLYAGPFLDGFHLADNLEFDEWADGQRAELSRLHQEALERLAVEAETHGDPVAAAAWWILLSREEPYSGWIVARAMESMAAAGDRGGALRLGVEHEALMREELGTGADAEVAELAERLRAEFADCEALAAVEGEAWEIESRRPSASPGSRATTGPALWVRRGAVVAASMVAALSTGSDGSPDPPLQRDLVRVEALENETGESALDPVREMARDWILKEAAETGAVRVARDRNRSRAGLVVAGAFHRQDDRLVFRARVEDAATGETLRTIVGVPADPAAPAAGAERLGSRVAGALATVVDPRLASWAHAASQPPSPAAYREFVRGIDEFTRFNMRESVAAFDRAAEEDPSFTAPRLWIALAYQAQHGRAFEDSVARSLVPLREAMAPWDRAMLEYYLARSRNDLRGAHRAARRLVEIVPDSEWRYLQAFAAIDVNRPREAVRLLDSMDLESGWLAGWGDAWWIYDNSLHLLGEYEREMEIVHRQQRLRPEEHFVAWADLGSLIGQGRIPEVLPRLEEPIPATPDARWNRATALVGIAGELRAHGHIEAAGWTFDRAFAVYDSFPSLKETNPFIYALLLYEAGRWEEARAAFAAFEPYTGFGRIDADLQGFQGLIAARLGEVERAREISERLATLPERRAAEGERPGYYEVWGGIYRARIAAVLGETEEAVTILRNLLVGGMSWRMIMIDTHVSIDYLEMRGHPLFQELIRPKS